MLPWSIACKHVHSRTHTLLRIVPAHACMVKCPHTSTCTRTHKCLTHLCTYSKGQVPAHIQRHTHICTYTHTKKKRTTHLCACLRGQAPTHAPKSTLYCLQPVGDEDPTATTRMRAVCDLGVLLGRQLVARELHGKPGPTHVPAYPGQVTLPKALFSFAHIARGLRRECGRKCAQPACVRACGAPLRFRCSRANVCVCA